MDNYLIDRGTLGRFIDELLKHKALSVSTTEELNAKREEMIKSLDEQISNAIFGQFTEAQNAEFNQLLDRDDEITEEDYDQFFERSGIDVEKIATEVMQKFATNFLGGQNA